MNETMIYILNIISIIFLIGFIAYIRYIVEEAGVTETKAIKNAFEKNWIYFRDLYAHKKTYICFYILVPILCMRALIQISQLNIGIPNIRPDWDFIFGSATWIFLFFAVKGLHHKHINK